MDIALKKLGFYYDTVTAHLKTQVYTMLYGWEWAIVFQFLPPSYKSGLTFLSEKYCLDQWIIAIDWRYTIENTLESTRAFKKKVDEEYIRRPDPRAKWPHGAVGISYEAAVLDRELPLDRLISTLIQGATGIPSPTLFTTLMVDIPAFRKLEAEFQESETKRKLRDLVDLRIAKQEHLKRAQEKYQRALLDMMVEVMAKKKWKVEPLPYVQTILDYMKGQGIGNDFYTFIQVMFSFDEKTATIPIRTCGSLPWLTYSDDEKADAITDLMGEYSPNGDPLRREAARLASEKKYEDSKRVRVNSDDIL
jgi:hypothetical protein